MSEFEDAGASEVADIIARKKVGRVNIGNLL